MITLGIIVIRKQVEQHLGLTYRGAGIGGRVVLFLFCFLLTDYLSYMKSSSDSTVV